MFKSKCHVNIVKMYIKVVSLVSNLFIWLCDHLFTFYEQTETKWNKQIFNKRYFSYEIRGHSESIAGHSLLITRLKIYVFLKPKLR